MTKIMLTAAVAAMALATTPVVQAQNMATPRSETAVSAPAGLDRIRSDEIRASHMIGSTVYDRQNQDVGKVKDLILNKDGRIDAVVVDVGSFLGVGGKFVALKPTDIKTDNNRLTLDLTKDQLKQARSYELRNSETGAGSSTSPVEGGRLGTPSHHREYTGPPAEPSGARYIWPGAPGQWRSPRLHRAANARDAMPKRAPAAIAAV